MRAGNEHGPACMQLGRLALQIVVFVDSLKIEKRERMLLDRDEMQPSAARAVGAPGAPGGEEVDAGAEAGFQDDEALALGPASGQVVSMQKDVQRLRRRAAGAVVEVAEGFG